MNPLTYHVLAYFNYDIEKLLDEFNHYYNIKYYEIPTYYQTTFMYFTHLSEIALQHLIKHRFPVKQAKALTRVLPGHRGDAFQLRSGNNQRANRVRAGES